jgi:hypothetical protein
VRLGGKRIGKPAEADGWGGVAEGKGKVEKRLPLAREENCNAVSIPRPVVLADQNYLLDYGNNPNDNCKPKPHPNEVPCCTFEITK